MICFSIVVSFTNCSVRQTLLTLYDITRKKPFFFKCAGESDEFYYYLVNNEKNKYENVCFIFVCRKT
jgi:hypothetical protein